MSKHEKTNHMLTLLLREEDEGHGTLFMSWAADPGPEDLVAVGIIDESAMESNSYIDELAELFRNHAGLIAEHMTSITTRDSEREK